MANMGSRTRMSRKGMCNLVARVYLSSSRSCSFPLSSKKNHILERARFRSSVVVIVVVLSSSPEGSSLECPFLRLATEEPKNEKVVDIFVLQRVLA